MGAFGSNPYSISRVLDEYEVDYKKIYKLDSIKEPGVYIISYWNSMELDSMIHTVAVKVDENGILDVKNGSPQAIYDGRFIIGYKIFDNVNAITPKSDFTFDFEIQDLSCARK